MWLSSTRCKNDIKIVCDAMMVCKDDDNNDKSIFGFLMMYARCKSVFVFSDL